MSTENHFPTMPLPYVPSMYRLTKCALDFMVSDAITDPITSVLEDFDMGATLADTKIDLERKRDRIHAEMKASIEEITKAYSDESLKTPTDDLFHRVARRAAYVYKYFVSHAYILKRVLLQAYCRSQVFQSQLECFLQSGTVRICAIGGGPGTDIAGFFLFMHAKVLLPIARSHTFHHSLAVPKNFNFCGRDSGAWNSRFTNQRVIKFTGENIVNRMSAFSPLHTLRHQQQCNQQKQLSKTPKIVATVLDNCSEWQTTADTLFETFLTSAGNDVCRVQRIKYSDTNFLDPNFSFKYCPDVADADVITLVKVVSAIAGEGGSRDVTSHALRSIFTKLKPGALVVFMDNAGGKYTEITRDAAKICGLEELYKCEHQDFVIPRHENSQHLEPYKKLFGSSPQRKARVSVVIWMKPYPIYNIPYYGLK